MIARALDLRISAASTTDFLDDELIPLWAKGAVSAIKNLEIIKGKTNHVFAPNDRTTRAEAATILVRILERKNS
ncbi:MAG: hypothetical protein K0Q63_3438 [Paenibacillus sp.]|nr:hypothetical protein [Paenibacillus sp.]